MTISRNLDIVIYMKAVNYFKALSDETRLRLLHIFLHHELNVNEIVAVTGMGQSRISRHLKILADNGLLTYRRDGLWTFYSAAEEGEGRRFADAVCYLFENGDKGQFAADLVAVERVLEERSKETVRFFDSIAEDWERLKREIFGPVDLNGMILEAVPETGTVVDLGCGTGDLVEALKTRAERVIGVEKSTRMLEAARKRFADHGENIQLRIGELEHLPLREGEADLVVLNMVMHHLPDPQKALLEAFRVLKPGKPFIIVDLLSHQLESMRERFGDRWLGFPETEVKKWLEAGGFEPRETGYFDLKKGLKGFMISSIKKDIQKK